MNDLISIVGCDSRVRATLAAIASSRSCEARAFDSLDAFLSTKRQSGVSVCVVVDPSAQGGDGWDAVAGFCARGDVPPVVVVASSATVAQAVAAVKAGAVSVIVTPARAGELETAIAEAMRKGRADAVRRREMEELRGREERLTRREHEVFERIVRGMMNKQIGLDLGIGERTVKIHRGNVMATMDALSVAELVRIASLLGLPVGD